MSKRFRDFKDWLSDYITAGAYPSLNLEENRLIVGEIRKAKDLDDISVLLYSYSIDLMDILESYFKNS